MLKFCTPTNVLLTSISSIFGQCIPTPLALISTTLGILSMLAWFCAQVPQLYTNYRLQSASGLSIFFLTEWLLGDIANLAGGWMTGQASWQVGIALYYVVVDLSLTLQYFWYTRLKAVRKRPLILKKKSYWTKTTPTIIAAALPATVAASPLHAGAPVLLLLGTGLSWLSSLLYLASRLPQLYKNIQRRSTAGLSPFMFLAAFCGNFLYSAAVMTNPCAWNSYPPHGAHGWVGPKGSDRRAWIVLAAPFWLGAAGVLVLDACVGLQFLCYRTPSSLILAPISPPQNVETMEAPEPIPISVDRVLAMPPSSWHRVTGWMRGWVPTADMIKKNHPIADICNETTSLLPRSTP